MTLSCTHVSREQVHDIRPHGLSSKAQDVTQIACSSNSSAQNTNLTHVFIHSMHADAVHGMQVATAAFKTLMALLSDTCQWEALTGCRTRLPTGVMPVLNCFA